MLGGSAGRAGADPVSADAGAIRTGFAQLTPEETAADLIARADNELLDQRNAADHR